MLIRLLLLTMCPALAAAAPAELRYRLKLNQELIYRTINREHPAAQPMRQARTTASQQTYRVIDQNLDGSWRMIQEGRELKDDLTPSADPPGVVEFILTPDGRIKMNPDQRGDPSVVLFELPADATAEQWDARGVDETALWHARRTPATEPSAINIDLLSDGLFDRLYEWKDQTTARFDLRRGLFTDERSRFEYPRHDLVRETTRTLISDRARDPAWIKQYGEQAHASLSARKTYLDALSNATVDGSFDQPAMHAALVAFRSSTAGVTLPELSGVADAAIDKTSDSPENARERQRLANVLHHPAAGWTLKDLSGRTHTLAEQKGKVVVLDFWYRAAAGACGACLR